MAITHTRWHVVTPSCTTTPFSPYLPQDIFDTGIRPLNESLCVYLMEHFVSAVLLPGILTTRQGRPRSHPPPTANRTSTAATPRLSQ